MLSLLNNKNKLRVFKLQIALLLHTSPQMYQIDDWERGVALVNKKVSTMEHMQCNAKHVFLFPQKRGFKVGVAFKFDHFVLSFNSFDNVFQVVLLLSCILNG